ncbi:hypothetical protein BGW37DRAFT_515359 [Umbelopsis sp. PMI_123]|nr:hypothetical protein BGW37DRAFT_515359 [Umbelopsis sp. PMI_123]
MDPGHQLLQKLKLVPNLVNEDPSIITPTNTSFMDMPWSDFSKLLAKQDRRASASSNSSAETSPATYDEQDINDESLGNWDAQIGYQEGNKIIRNH